MLRGILFDFNGVLLDDEPLHFELFRRVLGEEGFELSEADYYREFVHFDDESGFRHALSRGGATPDPARIARLGARKAAYYQERIKEECYPFFVGAVDLVKSAADRGLVLGVVSGALRSEIEQALRQEGIDGLIKVVVAAEDVEESKPNPAGYLRGLEELNSKPPLPERLFHSHEVLAIEDTPFGLQAASAAGLLTLAVVHTVPVEELREADLTASSLDRVRIEELQAEFADVRFK